MGKCSKNNDKSTYKNYVHMSTVLLLKYSVNVYDGEREGEIEREKTTRKYLKMLTVFIFRR